MPIPVGILLAAGRGERFRAASAMDENKLLWRLQDGRRVIEASADAMCAVLDEIVLITTPGATFEQCRFAGNLRVIVANEAALGMGHSLAAGASVLPVDQGIIVALGDMPAIKPSSIQIIADALEQGADIAAPIFKGRRGHPVGFAARYRDALCALKGDVGARDLLRREADRVLEIVVDDPGILMDVDLPSMLQGFVC